MDTASFSAAGISDEGAALLRSAQSGNRDSVLGWLGRGGDINAVFSHVRFSTCVHTLAKGALDSSLQPRHATYTHNRDVYRY